MHRVSEKLSKVTSQEITKLKGGQAEVTKDLRGHTAIVTSLLHGLHKEH